MPLGLTKYGMREWIGATVVAAGLIALAAWRLWAWPLAFWPATVVVGTVWLWAVTFFRDPRRTPPLDPRIFVCPADGRVADVTNLGSDSALGCEGVQIGIFMSVFNVHVNRSPCDGLVEEIVHRPGVFLDVRDPHAWERNESATIRLTCRLGSQEHRVLVRQVAGLVARRIVTDLVDGQTVSRGQRIGMIKFGSRLEVLAPREMVREVMVKVGDRVRAGVSPLLSARIEP